MYSSTPFSLCTWSRRNLVASLSAILVLIGDNCIIVLNMHKKPTSPVMPRLSGGLINMTSKMTDFQQSVGIGSCYSGTMLEGAGFTRRHSPLYQIGLSIRRYRICHHKSSYNRKNVFSRPRWPPDSASWYHQKKLNIWGMCQEVHGLSSDHKFTVEDNTCHHCNKIGLATT